jgi:hypothetical protein
MKDNEMDSACNMYGEDEKKNWSENLNRRDHFESLDTDVKILLQRVLKKRCWKVWTGFILLEIRSGGVCL